MLHIYCRIAWLKTNFLSTEFSFSYVGPSPITINIHSLQMDNGFSATAKDLVRNLRLAFLQFM